MKHTQSLSARLRSARINQHLSLRDIEKVSKKQITNSYICQIEVDKTVPSPQKLRVLCGVLKLDFIEMMILANHITIRDLKGRLS